MYCVRCGTALKENARFCGRCGTTAPVVTQPVVAQPAQVVYVEEKPIESLWENKKVLLFTFLVMAISVATIICTSIITKDLPSMSKLDTVTTSKTKLFQK